jgi:hypothetical protein
MNPYQTYYLRFNSQEEAETKLTEVKYRQEEEYYPQTIVLAPEPDENGEDVYVIETSTESQTRVWYSITDQVGDIDIVGEIWNDDGVYDEETFEVITPPTKMDGWHINIILQGGLPEELQEFIVTPNSPYRVFA